MHRGELVELRARTNACVHVELNKLASLCTTVHWAESILYVRPLHISNSVSGIGETQMRTDDDIAALRMCSKAWFVKPPSCSQQR